MEKDFSQVVQRFHPQQRVHEHEVFLSFDGDDEALAFTEWMHIIGWSIFEHHLSVKND